MQDFVAIVRLAIALPFALAAMPPFFLTAALATLATYIADGRKAAAATWESFMELM